MDPLDRLPTQLQRLDRIRGLTGNTRAQVTTLLQHWLRHVPYLVEINPLALLESIGIIKPKRGSYGEYETTQLWRSAQARPAGAFGLLWWLERKLQQPDNTSIDVGLSIWCRLGAFHLEPRFAQDVTSVNFSAAVWEAVSTRFSNPNPDFVHLLQIVGGTEVWGLHRLLTWKDIIQPTITNPCGEIYGVGRA